MYPLGVIIDCLCVFIGTNIGCFMQNRLPEKLKHSLHDVFGVAAIAIGITSLIKLSSLPAVILSLILGMIVGELLDAEKHIKSIFSKILLKFKFSVPNDEDEYLQFYLIVAITFCASGTNIFGAIDEGITGDFTILLSKATMDIFASVIFASTLGKAMNLIIIPQFLILSLFFYSSQLITPFITANMFNDFIAVGGLMTFILGLNIAKIKSISAVNLLPALLIVWPASYTFSLFL